MCALRHEQENAIHSLTAAAATVVQILLVALKKKLLRGLLVMHTRKIICQLSVLIFLAYFPTVVS